MMSIPLLSYFAGHWMAYRLARQRKPLLAGLKLTHRCNLRCLPCPFWRRPRPDMPFEVALGALDELCRAGCRLLIIEGGEPFLWRDGPKRLEDVVCAARECGFARVGVTTNGTLPIETSADMVWVSVDGMREAHEAIRGACWDRVMDNLAASAHPRLYAQVTVNRKNWADLPRLVPFLANRVQGITVQFFYPYPESEDLWLPWPERRLLLEQLRTLKRQGYPILDSDRALRELGGGGWRCRDWLIANAEPDAGDPAQARVHYGCYLKGRADADCRRCGFTAHAELSLAYDLHPGALWTGQRVFDFLR
jgi:MoaA/NifB/PqqE/SkfB family radical SAM enzyme